MPFEFNTRMSAANGPELVATNEDEPPLPDDLRKTVLNFVGRDGYDGVTKWLRPPDECMTPTALSAYKSSRVSFARVLARRMIDEKWRIERRSFQTDSEGDAEGRYEITIGHRRFSYIVRGYRWDGTEKVGRRADGAYRDVFGAIFLGTPDENRIAREFATFDTRDATTMRTDATVVGWNPANRSARFFDYAVDSLTAGHQPDPAVIGRGGGYLLRNGGFLGSGRNGTLSYDGFPADHPFRHPYFADLFGLYLIRQVSIDLVNGIARQRNSNAARLSPEISRYLGVGNSSGQGMCVAMQRWPHWVATWVLTRELALAYAKSMPLGAEPFRAEQLCDLLSRATHYLRAVQLQSEDYVVPPATIAANLETIRWWVYEAAGSHEGGRARWGDLVARARGTFDLETVEQFNSLLIEVYPEFADAAADYLPVGANRDRDLAPEMTVGHLHALLCARYRWALRFDMGKDGARQHFWYHSSDNGEQRRGERLVDPHEEFESFIDHIGAIQRLSAVLATYDSKAPIAEVVADTPDLAYAASRVQYLAGVPYCEIRGNLIDREFIPAHLIRFMLSVLGIECTNPLSVQYVRGVFFQGMPLPEDIIRGANGDWQFPASPALPECEVKVS